MTDRNDTYRNDENLAAWMIGGGNDASARSWSGRELTLRQESLTAISPHPPREPVLRRISPLVRDPQEEVRSTVPGERT